MKRSLTVCFAVLFAAATALAQTPEITPQQEQAELNQAIGEAGNSPLDFTRALERHLAKYPQTQIRVQIEKALAKSALDSGDRARIILYGERVLQADPKNDDLPLIDRVTRSLLDQGGMDSPRRALQYARRYEAEVESMRPRAAEGHMSEGQWAEEVDKGKARALTLEARALGNTGDDEDAVRAARAAWDTQPNGEAARELAFWLARLGRNAEAVTFYANAFAIDDGRSTEADRARDRVRLNELYTGLHGSETGLGDAVLRAYDRMVALRSERLRKRLLKDPNAAAKELMDFTLPNVDGAESISLTSLKGKTIVMDFWATWCGPCRVQHPMIENVKKKFEKSGNIVFLSVDSDDDHSVVPKFLKEMKFGHRVYYDAGLNAMLKIASIPTVLVVDPAGKISSRMTGFIPERFEEMLTQRIEEAAVTGN